MPKRRVDFYFDYLSGYAYFAWYRLRKLCVERDLELGIHPVLFAGLLNHWGQLGPAEIPPKRAFVYRDGSRTAAMLGLHFECPKYHPFNPLAALRVSTAEVAGEHQAAVVEALWDSGWGQGIDLGSREELQQALDEAGLDGAALLARVDDPAVKEAFRRQTEEAIALGVFGVPTMIIGGELFWGSDRFDHIELFLDGNDPVDHEAVARILARTKKADRRDRSI